MSAEDRDMSADDLESEAEQAEECRPKRPLWQRILKWTAIVVGGTIVFLVFAAFMLYNFGGMWGSANPAMKPAYAKLVVAGEAPPLRKRFVIPIPGCQCHSDDPVLTAQHSTRHMNECGKCHNTNPAHMEPGVQ